MNESFSKKVKVQITADRIKKRCCRSVYEDTMKLSLRKKENLTKELSDISKEFKCEGCAAFFFRALFIIFGSVTDPEKAYHLDFSFTYQDERDFICEKLEDAGFSFHKSVRRERYVAYIKESSTLEDFLVFIGAAGAAFELMNSKIVHEFRNSVNRQVNCDTANIDKQLKAVRKYVDAVQFLVDSGNFEKLPEELKETAKLRIENDQLSIAELGKLTKPPISKSGMKHRLEKIYAIAAEIKGSDGTENTP